MAASVGREGHSLNYCSHPMLQDAVASFAVVVGSAGFGSAFGLCSVDRLVQCLCVHVCACERVAVQWNAEHSYSLKKTVKNLLLKNCGLIFTDRLSPEILD